MSEKIWKVIDKICMYSMIGVNLVHIALINIYPNNVNVGLSTIISLSYISHILQEQPSHKHTNDMRQKGEC